MKFRMYTISFMAVNKTAEPPPGETKSMVYWAHRAAVRLAESIETVGRDAKEQAYRLFPESAGYSLHSVVVSPIEQSFFDELETACASDVFFSGAGPGEVTKVFNFDPDVVNDYCFETDRQTH